MDQEGDKLTRDLLMAVVHNDMTFARAFAAVARSRYEQGRIDEANVARLKALKFCFKAHESVIRIAEDDRKSDLEELEKLRSTIASLATPTIDPAASPSAQQATSPTADPPKVSKRRKFWQD